jgi:hypothetical protein
MPSKPEPVKYGPRHMSDATKSEDSFNARVKGTYIEVQANGQVDVYTNEAVRMHPATAYDSAAKTTHEIGDVEKTGEHKGEIYGGLYPADNKAIWFSAAPKIMDHYAAAGWAAVQGGSLPTRKQGDYLTTLKGKGGAFTELFNRGNSFPAGYVRLEELDADITGYAWCQRLSDGHQDGYHRNTELPVLCVRR